MRQCSPARRVGATRFGGFLEPKQSGENGGAAWRDGKRRGRRRSWPSERGARGDGVLS
jgi:hypothetical protein